MILTQPQIENNAEEEPEIQSNTEEEPDKQNNTEEELEKQNISEEEPDNENNSEEEVEEEGSCLSSDEDLAEHQVHNTLLNKQVFGYDSDEDPEDEWTLDDDNENFESSGNRMASKRYAVYTGSLSTESSELTFFKEIFDDEVIQNIVDQTNLYGKQESKKQTKDSPAVFVEVSKDEMCAYLGCLVLMGIHKLPLIDNYWSTDPALRVQSIAEVLSYKRFKKITESLHINVSSKVVPKGKPNYDKLYKIRPLLDHLNQRFLELYEPSSFIGLNESTFHFDQKCQKKQLWPVKYRTWCLADSQSNYIMKIHICPGSNQDVCLSTLADLCDPLKGSNCVVALNTSANSYSLMKKLLVKNIFSCGAVPPNSIEVLKDTSDLQKEQVLYAAKCCVAAIKLVDNNKPIVMLSTVPNVKKVSCISRRVGDYKTVTALPKVIKMYSDVIGSLNRFDRRKESYAIGRVTMKWWHRIFHFLLDLAISNAFALYSLCHNNTRNQLAFRIRLARLLIATYASRKRKEIAPVFYMPQKRGVVSVPDEIRKVQLGSHFPETVKTWRRCRKCSSRKVEKRTKIICSTCKVPLCINPCFSAFHE